MKTVFITPMVAHVWAQQSQPEGRNGGGSLFFDGPSIYSYGSHFEIARFVTRRRRRCVLLTNRASSVTTTGHVSQVRRAIPGDVPVFTIQPGLTARDARRAYAARIRDNLSLASRARLRAESYLSEARAAYDEALAYAQFFGLEWSNHIKLPDDMAQAMADARAAGKIAAAKQAKRDAAKRRALQLKHSSDFLVWRETGGQYCPSCYYPTDGSSLLAYNRAEDQVETSHGASVPGDHARRAWPIIKRMRADGVSIPDRPIRLGHFAVDRINGDLSIGCHRITWAEAERVADKLGLS
jgi:hypothetical protein